MPRCYINIGIGLEFLNKSYDVIMGAIASQIISLTIVYPIVYSGADYRKYQSSALLAFVRGILRWRMNSPHKWPVTRKMFPFDDVITNELLGCSCRGLRLLQIVNMLFRINDPCRTAPRIWIPNMFSIFKLQFSYSAWRLENLTNPLI